MLELDGKTFLVTGANGFIGRFVVGLLDSKGATIRALSGPPDGQKPSLPAHITCAIADFRSDDDLLDFFSGVDVVIHLAGPPSVRESFSQAPLYADVHIGGTIRVLEACRETAVGRFIYLSSAEVYGQPERNPVKETDPLRPRSPYGLAKASAEAYVQSYGTDFGLGAVTLRPFSVYGPPPSRSSLLGTILKAVISGDPILLENLSTIRDYVFVEDVAHAVFCAATADLPRHCVMNVGTGKGTSILELVALIMEILQTDVPVRERPGAHQPRTSDIRELIASAGLAQTMLGWSPLVSLRRGLERTIEELKIA